MSKVGLAPNNAEFFSHIQLQTSGSGKSNKHKIWCAIEKWYVAGRKST